MTDAVNPASPPETVPLLGGWLDVDDAVRARVEAIATLVGAHPADKWDPERDLADAIALRRLLPGIAAAIAAVGGEDETPSTDQHRRDALVATALRRARARLDRAAREVVTAVWEHPRHRVGAGRLTRNLTHGMAWSPAARALILPDGATTPEKPNGRLELEHVVPASTLARLVAAMVDHGRTAEETAEALRSCVRLVVVVKSDRTSVRDQPASSLMRPEMERLLLARLAATDDVDPQDLFPIVWSRYLDPVCRGQDARAMCWELRDLDTLTRSKV